MPPKTEPKPPDSLRKTGKKFWKSIASAYALEPNHFGLLAAACMYLDRADEAREIVAREGLTLANRFGEQREHPAVAIERQAMAAFTKTIAQMGFDDK